MGESVRPDLPYPRAHVRRALATATLLVPLLLLALGSPAAGPGPHGSELAAPLDDGPNWCLLSHGGPHAACGGNGGGGGGGGTSPTTDGGTTPTTDGGTTPTTAPPTTTTAVTPTTSVTPTTAAPTTTTTKGSTATTAPPGGEEGCTGSCAGDDPGGDSGEAALALAGGSAGSGERTRDVDGGEASDDEEPASQELELTTGQGARSTAGSGRTASPAVGALGAAGVALGAIVLWLLGVHRWVLFVVGKRRDRDDEEGEDEAGDDRAGGSAG